MQTTTPDRSLKLLLPVALLAAGLSLPILFEPLRSDGLHSIRQAAVTLQDPSRFLLPCMGGWFRPLPKLVFMGGVLAWGVRAWPYRLIVMFLHVLCTLEVARLALDWSNSRRPALLAAALFAIGFGTYAKPVLSISNVTMLLSLVFLLGSAHLLWTGRWAKALLTFALAALSHEIVLVAPVLIPFLVVLRRARRKFPGEAHHGPLRTRTAPAILAAVLTSVGVLSLIRCGPGRVCRVAIELGGMLLIPANVPKIEVVSALMELAALLTPSRFWIGLAIAAAVVWLVTRRGVLWTVSAAWIYVFLMPAALFMTPWGIEWLERRYLYVSAVGACILVADVACRLRIDRPRLASLFLVLVVAWTLSLDALAVWMRHRYLYTPQQVQVREVFYRDMAELDPRLALPSSD